jgi:hypothetical protein
LKASHELVMRSTEGPNTYAAMETMQPRNCTIPDSICFVAQERPDLGFTRLSASIPFNDQVNRLIGAAEVMANKAAYFAEDSNHYWNLEEPTWETLQLISKDIISGLQNVDERLAFLLSETLKTHENYNSSFFTILLVASLVGLIAFSQIGLQNLEKRTLALTSLIFQVPESMINELPELKHLLDSHGRLNTFSAGLEK